jgi:hypothetical protein
MADVIETDYTTDPPTVTERDFTPAEKAQIEADKKAAKELDDAEKAAEERRRAAIAKLTALGLDAEDLQALGLTP